MKELIMQQQPSPYLCHLFVCSNVRENRPDNPGCGARGGEELKAVLKKEINDRGWKGRVRVSATGCMGLCGTGPNILLHPQGIHFSAVTEHDLETVLETVSALMD
jgi:(2Fe-2S) ferredoxin